TTSHLACPTTLARQRPRLPPQPTHPLAKGDIFVIPSWVPWSLQAETQFDLFRFSDAPIIERLHFDRVQIEDDGK
ncbi:MAG: hypothetical protein ACK414_13445, partial [Gemmobacter sp.]